MRVTSVRHKNKVVKNAAHNFAQIAENQICIRTSRHRCPTPQRLNFAAFRRFLMCGLS